MEIPIIGGKQDGLTYYTKRRQLQVVLEGETYIAIQFKVEQRVVTIYMLADTTPESAMKTWKERQNE